MVAVGLLGLVLGFSDVSVRSAVAQSDSPAIPQIEWDTTLRKFQFDADRFIGQRLTVICPPAPAGQSFEGLYGTDAYPSDSSLCIAALHAGQITKEGGRVTVQLNPGESAYTASTRNGVPSSDRPETARSITFIDASASAADDKTRLANIPLITWETRFTRTGFAHRHLVGQRFTFRCPPAPHDLRSRIVYGTDSYDFSSIICLAALHAGKITKDGGIVTVQMDAGVPELVGSIRNGVETKSKRGKRSFDLLCGQRSRETGRQISDLLQAEGCRVRNDEWHAHVAKQGEHRSAVRSYPAACLAGWCDASGSLDSPRASVAVGSM